MGDFDSLCLSLDPDSQVRGRQFEHVCKWFLENDPVYRHELKTVWLWNDWPGRWGGDAGIDLVAEDRNGHLWAIQAKAYDPRYRVSKKDVDKFLAESGRKVFTYRMLIATTDLIDRTGERTIQQQEKRSSFFRLNDLRAAAVDWPASPAALRPVKTRKPAQPRPHQKDAIRDVVKGLQTTDRGQLIMACGTGKTLTALFLNEALESRRTLVLVPSLSLLKQTLNEWRANASIEFASLPVCSDDSVTGDDAAVAHTADLHVPAETDPAVIAAFLRRRSAPLVVFATYQSSPRVAEAFTLGRVPGFDLIVADEAHRCAGPVSSDFATVLDPAAIKGARRLFMTATPRYFTGRVLKAAQEADFEYASMDDEATFGPVLHRLPFGEAIDRDLLTDYQVAVVGVDDATYRQWADKGALVTRDGKTIDSAATLAGQIGLATAMRKYDLRRMISFHSRVARAREFAASLPGVIDWMPARQRPRGAQWTDYASGEMPAGDRYRLLQRLGRLDAGERGLLANARCLAEGVDVPTLDGVAFIDPRRSEVDIVQAVGRAIRKSEAKTVGTIAIPVFIDTDADPEVALDSSAFKPVWDVIKALRAHDAEFGEQLDSLRREMGRTGGTPKLPDKIHLDVPAAVGADFARAFDARLVQQTTQPWEFWYGLLEKYVAEHGTARVLSEHRTAEGYQLGKWVSHQRSSQAKGTLSEARRLKLESIAGWSWAVWSETWEFWLGLMEEFIAAHGHSRVPMGYVADGGHKLRNWVGVQRSAYATGQLSDERRRRLEDFPGWTWDLRDENWTEHYAAVKVYAERWPCSGAARFRRRGSAHRAMGSDSADDEETAAPERIALLEAIPGWSWEPHTDMWEQGYAALLQFVEREGHARVPAGHDEGAVHLGSWVKIQRRSRDRLGADRQQRLESLPNWSWDTRADDWFRKLALLERFQAREGHCIVPQGHTEDGVGLGAWVQNLRDSRESMPANRRRLLEALAGWTWDPHAESWGRGYSALAAFARREGHARVPQRHREDGFKLGGWVSEQRHNRSTMGEERRGQLEALDGWSWNPVEDAWMKHLELLRTYAVREGHTSVPVDHIEDGMNLGQWARLRRREFEKLTSERRALLEAIPGWFWGTKGDQAWEQKYSLLRQFAAREGHSAVPGDHHEAGVKLGQWVQAQRAARENLAPERLTRLEALPGWSWSLKADSWDDRYVLLSVLGGRGCFVRA